MSCNLRLDYATRGNVHKIAIAVNDRPDANNGKSIASHLHTVIQVSVLLVTIDIEVVQFLEFALPVLVV